MQEDCPGLNQSPGWQRKNLHRDSGFLLKKYLPAPKIYGKKEPTYAKTRYRQGVTVRKSRDSKEKKTLLVRSAVFGLAGFMAVTLLLIPASWQQYRQNEADLQSATRVQAVETAIRLQQEIDHHLKLLELLRAHLLANPDSDFRTHAVSLTRSWPAFQAVNWINPQGTIVAVVPEETNSAALGMNLLDVPDAAPAYRRALANAGELAVTPPLELRQGGRGITSYLAVHDGERLQGVLNGVFRLQPLFEGLLGGGLLERYAVRVTDQDRLVYSAGDIVADSHQHTPVSVMVDGRNWQLLLAPRSERVANFAAQFRQHVAGILTLATLAGLMTGLLLYKQMSLRGTERRFRELNQLLPDMVFECDASWRITYLNRLAQQRLGYLDMDIENGIQLDELLCFDNNDEALRLLRDERSVDQPLIRISAINCRDGSNVSCEVTLGVVRNETGQFLGLRGVLRDITERLEAERALNRLANFDTVTQLPNRAMFLQVLAHELRQASDNRAGLVLMVIDLDNFKNINDRLGPSLGDVLLREAGQRLREALNHQEYVFRISGDEFAVLFDNLKTDDDIDRMAQLMLTTLRKPYRLRSSSEELVDATIGVSRYPDDATTMEQMYMHADAAVYEAKAEGGRRYRIFTHEISRQLNERKLLEEALRHAVRRDELRLHYQPVMDVSQNKVVGLEALVRWQHPTRGLLSPYHFIRVAEETGVIDEIGAWVLQEACRQVSEWDRQGLFIPQIAVNVSPHQLESGVLGTDVRRALADHNLDGERLVLELTESLLMNDVHYAAHTLHELKRHGVKTAVDDFGTGYSSLAYLNRLPLDTLKIDRAFVAPIAEAGGDTRVTEAVIALARSLKLRTVAEGVENAQQVEFLLQQGCTLMQGYYFHKPMPAEQISELPLLCARMETKPRRVSA